MEIISNSLSRQLVRWQGQLQQTEKEKVSKYSIPRICYFIFQNSNVLVISRYQWLNSAEMQITWNVYIIMSTKSVFFYFALGGGVAQPNSFPLGCANVLFLKKRNRIEIWREGKCNFREWWLSSFGTPISSQTTLFEFWRWLYNKMHYESLSSIC